ncbi:MAG: AAA family ATPase, partial [Cyanobacteria bacterium J06648_11]
MQELEVLIKAQYPLICLLTPEEDRAERAIAAISRQDPERRLFVWTVTHGIV